LGCDFGNDELFETWPGQKAIQILPAKYDSFFSWEAQPMSKVKVSFSVSIDGFGAASQQSLENQMGVGGEALAEWAFATRTFQRMHGKEWTFQRIHGKDGVTTGTDGDFFARSFLNVGAWIFGRNMLGPVRRLWRDNSWKGGWARNRTLVTGRIGSDSGH
jgi:hypothetical protein